MLKADPAEEEGHGVMVEMKETKGSLAKNNEESVQELVELGDVEDVGPEVKGALACGQTLMIANETIQSISLE